MDALPDSMDIVSHSQEGMLRLMDAVPYLKVVMPDSMGVMPHLFSLGDNVGVFIRIVSI